MPISPGLVSGMSIGTTNIKAKLGAHETLREASVVAGASSLFEEAGTGLKASYFSNNSLNASGLAGIGTDSKIDYNWARGAAPWSRR